jgi:alpha-tubulin suppressor-like RCC1 family protein
LYTNRENWGIDFGQKILSVVAKDASDDDFPYGQFVVLLEDGTIRLLWSDVCINKLSDNNNYVSVTSGCCGLVFGLKSDGTVDVFNFTSENLYIADEVTRWSDITQIDAGPRHIVGLKKDGTVVASGKPSACKPLEEWKDIKKIYVSKAAPYWGKENDLTFGIGNDGWLQVEGDCWSKGKEFWKRIRAQYDVSDVIENGYMVWVRTNDGELRCITYYSKMNYWDEIEFVKKYPNFRFIDTYGDITVIVDESGEFRIMSSNSERKWWNYNLK